MTKEFAEHIPVVDTQNLHEILSHYSLLTHRALDTFMHEQASRGALVWVQDFQIRFVPPKDSLPFRLESTLVLSDSPEGLGVQKDGVWCTFEKILKEALQQQAWAKDDE